MPMLKYGQSPLKDLVRVEKAHDVRTLRGCKKCGRLGNAHTMIDIASLQSKKSRDWYHGRCFVRAFGFDELLALPATKQDRLTLGDLGVAWMKDLIKARG